MCKCGPVCKNAEGERGASIGNAGYVHSQAEDIWRQRYPASTLLIWATRDNLLAQRIARRLTTYCWLRHA